MEPKLLNINPQQAHLAVGGGTNPFTGWGKAPARGCCVSLFCTSQRSSCSSWGYCKRWGGCCLGHGMLGNAFTSCCCRDPHSPSLISCTHSHGSTKTCLGVDGISFLGVRKSSSGDAPTPFGACNLENPGMPHPCKCPRPDWMDL